MTHHLIGACARLCCAVATATTFFLAPAQAALLRQIDANGILTGATGINVGGKLFTVEFKDGTCKDLFDECDAAMDFAFQSKAQAETASQALTTQVVVDVDANHSYDSKPYLIRGCASTLDCLMLTPYATDGAGKVTAIAFDNFANEAWDDIGGIAIPSYGDSTDVIQYVYAVWTLEVTIDNGPPRVDIDLPDPGAHNDVPEPSTLLLFSGAMGLLAWRQQKTGPSGKY